MTDEETKALADAVVAVLPDLDYLDRHRGNPAGSRRLKALRAALRAAAKVPS